jgi:uncharacterized protein with HEPN domain
LKIFLTQWIIREYTDNMTYEALLSDRMRLDAVVRNLEVIGEAAGKIPQNIRKKYALIEWRKIADLRNILAHEYFGIDYEILWNIITDKLPALRQGIQLILEEKK